MKLYTLTEQKMDKIMKGHHDVTSAMVDITDPAKGEGLPSMYQVNVTLYARPNNIAAIKKNDDVKAALRDSLDAVERQIREKRERLRDH